MKKLVLFLLLCTATSFATHYSFATVSVPVQKRSIDIRYYGDFVFHIDNVTNEIVDITSDRKSVV